MGGRDRGWGRRGAGSCGCGWWHTRLARRRVHAACLVVRDWCEGKAVEAGRLPHYSTNARLLLLLAPLQVRPRARGCGAAEGGGVRPHGAVPRPGAGGGVGWACGVEGVCMDGRAHRNTVCGVCVWGGGVGGGWGGGHGGMERRRWGIGGGGMRRPCGGQGVGAGGGRIRDAVVGPVCSVLAGRSNRALGLNSSAHETMVRCWLVARMGKGRVLAGRPNGGAGTGGRSWRPRGAEACKAAQRR